MGAEAGPPPSAGRRHGPVDQRDGRSSRSVTGEDTDQAERRTVRVSPESAQTDQAPTAPVDGHHIRRRIELRCVQFVVEPEPVASPTVVARHVPSKSDIKVEQIVRRNLIGLDEFDPGRLVTSGSRQRRAERNVVGGCLQVHDKAGRSGGLQPIGLVPADRQMDGLPQLVDGRMKQRGERRLRVDSMRHKETVVRSDERGRQADDGVAVGGKPACHRLLESVPFG